MYSKKEVIENLKGAGVEIDAPALAYYLKLEIVKPAEDAAGRGKVKRHSPENLADIAIARTLEKHGLRLAAVKAIMDQLRERIRLEINRGTVGAYRFQVIVQDPNGENQNLSTQKCLLKENQRTRRRVAPGEVKLNLDLAGAYLVVDITELLKKLAAFF
jgi:DNA-binding transcriptional MerR regulator